MADQRDKRDASVVLSRSDPDSSRDTLERLAPEVDQPGALDRFIAAARHLFSVSKDEVEAAEKDADAKEEAPVD